MLSFVLLVLTLASANSLLTCPDPDWIVNFGDNPGRSKESIITHFKEDMIAAGGYEPTEAIMYTCDPFDNNRLRIGVIVNGIRIRTVPEIRQEFYAFFVARDGSDLLNYNLDTGDIPPIRTQFTQKTDWPIINCVTPPVKNITGCDNGESMYYSATVPVNVGNEFPFNPPVSCFGGYGEINSSNWNVQIHRCNPTIPENYTGEYNYSIIMDRVIYNIEETMIANNVLVITGIYENNVLWNSARWSISYELINTLTLYHQEIRNDWHFFIRDNVWIIYRLPQGGYITGIDTFTQVGCTYGESHIASCSAYSTHYGSWKVANVYSINTPPTCKAQITQIACTYANPQTTSTTAVPLTSLCADTSWVIPYTPEIDSTIALYSSSYLNVYGWYVVEVFLGYCHEKLGSTVVPILLRCITRGGSYQPDGTVYDTYRYMRFDPLTGVNKGIIDIVTQRNFGYGVSSASIVKENPVKYAKGGGICIVPTPTRLTDCGPSISSYSAMSIPSKTQTTWKVNPTVSCTYPNANAWRKKYLPCSVDPPPAHTGDYNITVLIPHVVHTLSGGNVISVSKIHENSINAENATWSIEYTLLDLLSLQYSEQTAVITLDYASSKWVVSRSSDVFSTVHPDTNVTSECEYGDVYTTTCTDYSTHAGTWQVASSSSVNTNVDCPPVITLKSCSPSSTIPPKSPDLFKKIPFEFWPIAGGCVLGIVAMLGSIRMDRNHIKHE